MTDIVDPIRAGLARGWKVHGGPHGSAAATLSCDVATLPSKPLMMALVAVALIGTALTRVGLPGLMPLPWGQSLAIFAYAMVSCLVVNDAVKVAMIKWRVPAAVASRVDKSSSMQKLR